MASKKRKKRKPQNNMLVLKLLILVAVVLVVFEGKLVITMFSTGTATESSSTAAANTAAETDTKTGTEVTTAVQTNVDLPSSASTNNIGVGLGSLSGDTKKQTQTASAASTQTSSASNSEYLDSFAVVPETSPSVDDSYFSDAVFVGDSRMEGFRNTSGITQGEFLTAVGMSLSAISNTKVNSSEGPITVYQGLSGRQYGKIYLMLGANDLGYYPWENFQDQAEAVLNQFHELQPGAIIYVCSCIYVEEAKISTSYVNNANVQKVNGYLLSACENLDFCHYINLNEKFSDGYHELIPGASQDGVHLFPDYTKVMLEYLKSHYLEVETVADDPEEMETDLA